MGPVVDVLEAGEEHGVVERRGELTGTTADVRWVVAAVQLAPYDRSCRHIPLARGSLTDVIVDREHLTRRNDRAIDRVGNQLDVGDAAWIRTPGRSRW